MNISEIALNPLAKIINGDNDVSPYLTGPALVIFFNKHGFNDNYDNGIGSRWKYVEDNLRSLNNTQTLNEVLEDILDPRRFHISGKDITKAVDSVNDLLKFDGYEMVLIGDLYKLRDRAKIAVESKTSTTIDHDFISEQISKCNKKLTEGDYNGAITNARSLIEAVFIEVIERLEDIQIKNDGSIESLWKRVKVNMRLDVDKDNYPDFVVQILSGIDTSVKGLAGLSNNAGDRHATKFKTRKHHGKLAVNLAITISEFLFESLQFQITKF
ncbi:abortive infection family protein [Pedobacter frigiditerrae]|uniref:abortive infection family protein n=1 Tax=Pedobacter frigiditerrae TaxID=2530452 RepID=UPI00292DCC77|nr:abortive infection family protein [Pedobacter frigiditerrae]